MKNRTLLHAFLTVISIIALLASPEDCTAQRKKKRNPRESAATDREYLQYAIYEKSAPRPKSVDPVVTTLPLKLARGARIALIGNGLAEQMQHYGFFETFVQQQHPEQQLVFRNLAWAADTPDLQPRPANFADTEQHLHHERADVIFAAYGFNESFAGKDGAESFRRALTEHVRQLKSKAFNGASAPQVVLLSPIANEDLPGVPAATNNNANLQLYASIVREVAAQEKVGFVDLFASTSKLLKERSLTFNGAHLTEDGYRWVGREMFQASFGKTPASANETIRKIVIDKNRQFFRRFRPLNTFYYTGGRNRSYGYLDFLPAMRNFDLMTQNRDRAIWSIAAGNNNVQVDDSNLPPLPETKQSRGANRWMTAKAEQAEFKVDPRFDVSLFAGEEEFPDIAAPIQMRWDNRGRLWVSCSTTYPHVYPGNEPDDKLVILEDTDGDGKADKSSTFADDLHIPLSFEFGNGGVFVSEMPHLTFLKDTDGDGKADHRQMLLTGFGTEDSHHALHDFVWTPDGDLLIRESIFHHSQIETPYGPVRQANSGWFLFDPETHRLTSFGTYHSTNPWGVTFDDWGRHVASHPIFAAAFHSLDPPYPAQHPRPNGLRAYSGTCGQEFVDFATFPKDLQGAFIKVRYKPTNRVEIHRWNRQPFGYDEKYESDIIFSSNLSFIPVDIGFGPRGALYVCDWYNPIKGHAQYSLRDDRRDRHSGRIWRILPKGSKPLDPPVIADADLKQLLELLKRPEYRIRYWAKRELRDRAADQNTRNKLAAELDQWVQDLNPADSRYRHHQLEAVWLARGIDHPLPGIIRQLIQCNDPNARAAAVRQLRQSHDQVGDAIELLRLAANDQDALVRMEAAIAASWIGSKEALDALLDVAKHPREGHLAYAFTCALGSKTMRRHWEANPVAYRSVPGLLAEFQKSSKIKEPRASAKDAEFDRQPNLLSVRIGCVNERMRFTVSRIVAKPKQPLKVVFFNDDATDHNWVLVKPKSLAEVGIAANEMARDPKNARSDFIPEQKRSLILQASPMIGPTRSKNVHVLRFPAPEEPGIYPFVCTFPGHWIMMRGELVVARSASETESLLAAAKPTIVKKWSMQDFARFESSSLKTDDETMMRGMQAFMKARCNQCHVVSGHGVPLGPELTDVKKRFQGAKLLQQILDPSSEINKKYQTYRFLLDSGKQVTGVVVKEDDGAYHVASNLLLPKDVVRVAKDDVQRKQPSKVSSMPVGLADVLTRPEIMDLVSFLQAGGYKLPKHLQHGHGHGNKDAKKP